MRTPFFVNCETWSNSPTTKHRRYVDIRGDVMKDVLMEAPSAERRVDFSGMFERAVMWAGTVRLQAKVALRRGSSQQGKQRRASMLSNCVEAMSFFSPFTSV